MSKGHSNSPALQECAKSDTEIQLSYDIMRELRRGLSLHSFPYHDKLGDWRAVIKLVYTTKDGKKHEIASTEIHT